MIKGKYEKFKDKVDSNRLYRLSFLSLMLQIGSAISIFIFMLLSLTLMQLSDKVTVDLVPLSRVNNSSKIVATSPFYKDMADVNEKVTKVMVQYFIETVFPMHFEKEEVERKFLPRAEVYYLTTAPVWEEVYEFMKPLIEKVIGKGGNRTSSVDIIDIRNLTSNLWQSYFDFRIYDPTTNEIFVERYVMNLRVGYYPERVIIGKTFTNPLGFAVTEFNIAKAKN